MLNKDLPLSQGKLQAEITWQFFFLSPNMDEGCNSIVTKEEGTPFHLSPNRGPFFAVWQCSISRRMAMKMKVEKRLQRQLASLKSCLKVYKFCSFLQKQLQTHLQEIKEATVIFSRIKIKACYHPWAVSLFIMVSYTAVVKGTIMRFLTTHICPQCQVTCSYSLSLAKTER